MTTLKKRLKRCNKKKRSIYYYTNIEVNRYIEFWSARITANLHRLSRPKRRRREINRVIVNRLTKKAN